MIGRNLTEAVRVAGEAARLAMVRPGSCMEDSACGLPCWQCTLDAATAAISAFLNSPPPSKSQLRLHLGEVSAQGMRDISAYHRWLAATMLSIAPLAKAGANAPNEGNSLSKKDQDEVSMMSVNDGAVPDYSQKEITLFSETLPPISAQQALERLDLMLQMMGLWEKRGSRGKQAELMKGWAVWLSQMRPHMEAAAARSNDKRA
jgi:hypothetical protein